MNNGSRPGFIDSSSRLSIALPFRDAIEHSYFDFYQKYTASSLSGYFETDIWNRLILQVCHEEPFARHAVIAIGALTKFMDTTTVSENSVTTEDANKHYEYALQRYGKAVRLMQAIGDQEQDNRLRNTVVSALLTTCFESCIGNQEIAMTQAQAGIEILATFQCGVGLLAKQAFLDDDLICTFARLDSQILMFREPQTRNSKLQSWEPVIQSLSPYLQDLPPVFASVKEARVYWDLIVEVAMLWRAASHPGGFSTLDFGENNIRETMWREDTFAQRIQHETKIYTATTERWFQSFHPVFERARAHNNHIDYLGATVLMIKYLSSCVAIPRPFIDLVTYESELLPDYIRIVQLAGDVLKARDGNPTKEKPVFIFDDSLVAGLFVVATRCRERNVRRQAIYLLRKYPRREGLWDSLMAATVATWFMETEEEGLEGDFIPASARLKIVKNDFVLSERRAVVRCSRVDDLGDNAELPEVTLTW